MNWSLEEGLVMIGQNGIACYLVVNQLLAMAFGCLSCLGVCLCVGLALLKCSLLVACSRNSRSRYAE